MTRCWVTRFALTQPTLLPLNEPNEIPARIVEIGELRRAHGLGLVSEHDALGPQALELGGDVFGVELRQRNELRVFAAQPMQKLRWMNAGGMVRRGLWSFQLRA